MDVFINFVATYIPMDILMYISTAYFGLLALQPFVMFVVSKTSTKSDDGIAKRIFDVLNAIGPDLNKLFSVLKK